MQKIKRGNACATEVKAWGEEKDSRRSSSNSSISSQKRRRRRRTKPSLSLDGKSIDRFFLLLHQTLKREREDMPCQLSKALLGSAFKIEFALGG